GRGFSRQHSGSRRGRPAGGASGRFVWHRIATSVRMGRESSSPTRAGSETLSRPAGVAEKVTMGTNRRGSRGRMVLAAGVLLAGAPAAPPRAEETVASEKPDEAGLRKQALALNDLTGAGPMEGRLKELTADAAGTKRLIAVALKMAKEKPQPLNRNATLVLAL